MTTVHELITVKGRVVHTVPHDAPVLEAATKMVAKNIGSVVVLREGDPCGILTERDFLKRVSLTDRSVRTTTVQEIMSSELVSVRPDTDIGVCMTLMTRLHLRHLPVLEEASLVGMISIGDIVKHMARASEHAVDELTHYIRGR